MQNYFWGVLILFFIMDVIRRSAFPEKQKQVINNDTDNSYSESSLDKSK